MNNAFEQVKKVTIEFNDGSVAQSSLFGNDALLVHALREECKMYKSWTEWQPIETAPKNNDFVLLFGEWTGEIFGEDEKNVICVGRYEPIHNEFNFNWICYGSEYYTCRMNPTHWMPLPKPPIL